MTQTTARLTKQGKHYEILVDLEEALKVKRGTGNLSAAVMTADVFHNLKSGEHVSSEDLIGAFGTEDFMTICDRIIKNGEVVLPTEFIKKEHDMKFKQAVEFLSKNAVSPEGRPYSADRITRALEEGKLHVKNNPINEQIEEIIEQLKKILPIKIEIKRIKVTIPAQHTGKAYGVVKAFNVEKEDWLSNGDLMVIMTMPAGLIFDFYDKLNSVTHGSALAEDVK